MRFQSVRPSRGVAAAQAVTGSMGRMYGASLDASPDFTELAKTAIETKSNERKAAMKAESQVANAGLDAATDVNINKQDAKLQSDIRDIKKPAARMAGLVGALGLGAGYFLTAKNNKADAELEEKRERLYDERTKTISGLYEKFGTVTAPEVVPIKMPDAPDLKDPRSIQPTAKTPDATKPSDSTKTSGDSVTDLSSPTMGSGSYDLSKLSDDDWKTMSRVVSAEQGGGDDRFGIVASVLNRVSSDQYPSTIKGVAYQNDGKGTYQYEAFTKGLDYNDDNLTANLKSPEGQAKILKALKVLDGRTDFKGQTMLKYRSSKGNKDYDGDGKPDLDPMFDPTGNFYHYNYQTQSAPPRLRPILPRPDIS